MLVTRSNSKFWARGQETRRPNVATVPSRQPICSATLTWRKSCWTLAQHFENRLLEIMKNASTIEPEEEHRKLKRAIGDVLVDLGEHLLSPIYRRHAELIPEPMKGELLW